MSTSINDAKAFCNWLDNLKDGDNYAETLKAFQQPTCFRAVWANVADKKILFRCRRHYGADEKIFFDHSSTIGYIRNEKVIKNLGRCNNKEQALMYLSENRDTAIIETLQNCKKDEICVITVGVWEMQKTVNTLCVVQPFKEKRKHVYEHELGKRYDAHVHEMKKKYPDYEDFSGIYFDYLDNRFKSDERGFSYQITAAYTNMSLAAIDKESGDKSQGIIYASVTQNDFYNVAFDKEVEEEKLILLKDAFKLKLKVLKDNPKSFDDFEILEIGKCKRVNDDGKIDW